MTPTVALRLGRVSNLPTVWSNLIAGVVLSEGMPKPSGWVTMAAGVSLAYVAGMFLNDAFDAAFDARERPDRPIPAGEVSQRQVFCWGYGLLAAGMCFIAFGGVSTGRGIAAGTAGLALAGLIVFYDRYHKNNRFGPVVMALCRVAVYVVAAATVADGPRPIFFLGCLMLTCHLVALTYVAKHEMSLRWRSAWPVALLIVPLACTARALADPAVMLIWLTLLAADAWALLALRRRATGDTRKAIMTLIAAISIVDALMVAATGYPWLAIFAACGFPMTLALQRAVPGT